MGMFGMKKEDQQKSPIIGDVVYMTLEQEHQKNEEFFPIAIPVEGIDDQLPANPHERALTPSPVVKKQEIQLYRSHTNKRGKGNIVFVTRQPTELPFCPYCENENVRTRTRTNPGILTWVSSGIMLLVFWPLFWIPCCTDTTRDTTHYCPKCNSEIGTIYAYQDCCVKYR